MHLNSPLTAIGTTYDNLFPHLKPDGLYIVEDYPHGAPLERKYSEIGWAP